MKIKAIRHKTSTIGDIWNGATTPEVPEYDHNGELCGHTKAIDLRVQAIDHGYPVATHVYKSLPKALRRHDLSDGSHIVCSPTQGLQVQVGNNWEWVQAQTLRQDESIVRTVAGSAAVVRIGPELPPEPGYDLHVPDVHHYVGNGIVTHNSAVAYQTAMNQAALGYKVVVVPLEMGVDETIARMMASVARMENKEIQFQRLTERERDLAWKRWRRFQKRMEEKGGRITLYKPLGEVSMQQVFAALHTYTFDIAYIDYIGLLAGVGGDKTEAQWLQMGNAVRYAKVYADQTKRAVVVLAQVDKEGQLRYSKAMEEHAATTWYFVATKESREAGNLRIEMTKGRNQEIMPFVLAIDYATQHVQDPVIDQHEETASTAAGDSADASESNAKQSTASKYLDDVTAD